MLPRRSAPGRAVLAAVILGGLTLAGCGRPDGRSPVAGKVVFADGTPLAGGTVQFESEADAADGYEAQIGADGGFTVANGLPPGRYRVGVLPADGDEGDAGDEGEGKRKAAPPRRPAVDPRFADAATSGLEAEVTADGNTFTFTVEPPSRGSRRRAADEEE